MKRGPEDPSPRHPASGRRWSFAALGRALGGATGARLTRMLEIALVEEPAALASAWEAFTAFESTHGPLEAVIRDMDAPPVRRLAAFGAFLAMCDRRLGRVGRGAVTTREAAWAAALFVTETEFRSGLDSLPGYGALFLVTLCEHAGWIDSPTGPWTPLRGILAEVPSRACFAAREEVWTLALAGIPRLERRCREQGQAEDCQWGHDRALRGLVRLVSIAMDRWLASATATAPQAEDTTTRREADDPLAPLAALDADGREEWIDQRTAARFLGVEVRTLQDYAALRGFPEARREGRRKLYPVLALIRWASEERRICRGEALPEPMRVALFARLPSVRELPDGHAFQAGLRKKRAR